MTFGGEEGRDARDETTQVPVPPAAFSNTSSDCKLEQVPAIKGTRAVFFPSSKSKEAPRCPVCRFAGVSGQQEI